MESVINTSLVSEVVASTKSVLGLLGEFPLNVIVIFMIAGLGFGLVKKGKRVVK